jgi:hypothetical protein
MSSLGGFSHFCLKPLPLILALGLALSPVVKSDTHLTSPSSMTMSFAELNRLTESDYQWIGQKIYQNECAGKPKYLTYWGKGETFPSFGIGHFIWHPKISENSAGKSAEVTFTETFPAMVRFVSQTQRPPIWLDDLSKQTEFAAPWSSKALFDQARSNDALQQLRNWLLATQSQQAQFIVIAFKKRWLSETHSLPLPQQTIIQQRLNRMMGFKKGLFAVIDYFNFKGVGVNQQEQYQTESWGLASVLRTMAVTEDSSQAEYLEQFVMAAKQRLRLRVRLAPPERNEVRWLKGWEVRLDQYLN